MTRSALLPLLLQRPHRPQLWRLPRRSLRHRPRQRLRRLVLVEAPRGQGYIAALVVNRVRGAQGRNADAFRDDSLACGYRWSSADEAMHYAMNRARELIRSRSRMLSC